MDSPTLSDDTNIFIDPFEYLQNKKNTRDNQVNKLTNVFRVEEREEKNNRKEADKRADNRL